MTRARQLILLIFFLGIIYAVPVTQAILEILEDERPQILELFSQAPTEENLRSFEADMEEYSFFEEKLRPVFQLLHYLTSRDMGAKALPGRDGWYFFHPGVKYLTEPYFRDIETANVLASGTVVGESKEKSKSGDPVEIIVDFVKQMKARGIQVLVVPIPGKASIYPDRLTPLAERGAPVYANTTRFMDELREEGVEVVAIHDLLVKQRAEADRLARPLYMATDTHWSGAGIRLAAEAIADRIKKESWYKKPAPRYGRKTIALGRRGDIPEMTKIPFQKRLFPTEGVECDQVFDAEDGTAYKDDPDSPILLLGDSFSRVFQTDDPKSAGLIANLAFELQMPLASIVNNGGASTLVRQQLARKIDLLDNKRLIVWEFVERDIRFGMGGWQAISYPPPDEGSHD
ncbi:MAG: hypothetical protein JRF33_23035 [Deltaproteobacteria bacterium]|nr:hypothetical protein [Deltaproteobacteria bacterium]